MFWNRKPPTKVEIAKRAVADAIHELSDRAHDILDSPHVESAAERLSAVRQSALEGVVEAERALNARIAAVRSGHEAGKSIDELERAARDARKRAEAEIAAAAHELGKRKKEAEKQLHIEQKQFESERARLSHEHEQWKAEIAAEVKAAQIEAEKLAQHEAKSAAQAQEELQRGALQTQKEAEKIAAHAQKEAERIAHQAEKDAERAAHQAEKDAERAAHQAEKEAYKAQKAAKKRGREIEVPLGETTILPVEIEEGDIEAYALDEDVEIEVREDGSRLPLVFILVAIVAALVYFFAPNSGRRSRAAIKDRLGKVKDDIVDASTKSSDATATRVEELVAKSDSKLDDISDAAPGIAAVLGEKIENASDALADKIENAAESARDVSMMASDKIEDVKESVSARIDEATPPVEAYAPVVSSDATSTFDEAIVVDEDIMVANIDEANSEATLQAPESESVTDVVNEAETTVEKIERAAKKKNS